MVEVLNPNTGLWEVQPVIVIPSFTSKQIEILTKMLDAQREDASKSGGERKPITNDPEGYIKTQEEAGQKTIQMLGECGLILHDPDLILHIGRQDWSDRGRIWAMDALELMDDDNNVDTCVDWIDSFNRLQGLRTGVIPLLHKKLMLRGYSFSEMENIVSTLQEKIMGATGGQKSVVMPGILVAIDRYMQSEEKQKEMKSDDGLCEYTSDVTAYNNVAILYDWNACGRVNMDVLDGSGYCFVGMSAGVVDTEPSDSES